MPQKNSKNIIETHSIDVIPDDERKGKVWHQGPFWFTGNFILTTMITGFIGPAAGLGLVWCICAIIAGVLFATFFMAFHANQGPTFGLPQMIQSRAQFGSRGSIVPYLAVVFVYIGFIVFDSILASDALSNLSPVHIGKNVWIIAIIALGLIIAIVGHDLIHFIQRWMAYILVPTFLLLTAGALYTLDFDAHITGGFSLSLFLMQFGAAAGYQLTYAVYVSDYTRYLPKETNATHLIAWVYAGAALSAIWMMGLGSLLGTAYQSPDVIGSVFKVGNEFIFGFGYLILIVALTAKLSQLGVSAYGGMLSVASAIDAYVPIKATRKTRIIGLIAIMIPALVLAIGIPSNYLGSFDVYVTFMLFLLVPWSSINLVDFYIIRRKQYLLKEMVKENGIYGRWNWKGLFSYGVGIVSALFFVDFSWFQGPFVKLLGGADISVVPGLVSSGAAYYFLQRNVDTDRGLGA